MSVNRRSLKVFQLAIGIVSAAAVTYSLASPPAPSIQNTLSWDFTFWNPSNQGVVTLFNANNVPLNGAVVSVTDASNINVVLQTVPTVQPGTGQVVFVPLTSTPGGIVSINFQPTPGINHCNVLTDFAIVQPGSPTLPAQVVDQFTDMQVETYANGQVLPCIPSPKFEDVFPRTPGPLMVLGGSSLSPTLMQFAVHNLNSSQETWSLNLLSAQTGQLIEPHVLTVDPFKTTLLETTVSEPVVPVLCPNGKPASITVDIVQTLASTTGSTEVLGVKQILDTWWSPIGQGKTADLLLSGSCPRF